MAETFQPPPPPSNVEQQTQTAMSRAEQAALMLFTISVLSSQEQDDEKDLTVIHKILKEIGKTIFRMTIEATQLPTRYWPVGWGSSSIENVAEVVARNVDPEMLRLVRDLRTGLKEEQAELRKPRQAAEVFAVHAYNTMADKMGSVIPTPEVFGNRVLKKTWISMKDQKVRPLHRRLHGRTVSHDKDFWRWPVTGQKLRFPGDPLAPPDAAYGCRCTCWLSWNTPQEVGQSVRRFVDANQSILTDVNPDALIT